MSNYNVGGNGPTQVIPLAIPLPIDQLIRNDGSKPVWLSPDPGIYTNGFMLPPGGTKIWVAGQGLYLQCNPGDVTTVTVTDNTGDFYTPAPLNVPRILWNARNVPTLDGQCPGRGTANPSRAGEGPDFFTYDTSSPTPSSVTGIIDVSNYSSVIISAFEYQPDIWSTEREVRRIQVTWYIQLSDGSYYSTTNVYYWHYCVGMMGITTSGQPTANPQFRIITPAQAQFMKVEVGAVNFVNPVPAGAITYNLLIIGDNRTIPEPIEYYDSGYYYVTETWNNEDMSVADLCSGNASLPTGANVISMTHRGGPHAFHVRMPLGNAVAADVGNRVLIRAVGTLNTNFIASYVFTAGMLGPQSITDTIYLPRRPVTLEIFNDQAGATTFNWSLVPIRQ